MEAASTEPFSLRATGRSRRRLRVNRIAKLVSVLAAFLAIGVLALVVGSVFLRGIKALNLDLFTQSQVTFGETGGGIANGLVGTVIMVGIATAITLPVGILIAIYVAEFGTNSVGRFVRLGPRRAERGAFDCRRHLRLRAAGCRFGIRRVEGLGGAVRS